VRLRPASEPYECVGYDPAELFDFADAVIEECALLPSVHEQFYLVDHVA
jgi:hypothetical protein